MTRVMSSQRIASTAATTALRASRQSTPSDVRSAASRNSTVLLMSRWEISSEASCWFGWCCFGTPAMVSRGLRELTSHVGRECLKNLSRAQLQSSSNADLFGSCIEEASTEVFPATPSYLQARGTSLCPANGGHFVTKPGDIAMSLIPEGTRRRRRPDGQTPAQNRLAESVGGSKRLTSVGKQQDIYRGCDQRTASVPPT